MLRFTMELKPYSLINNLYLSLYPGKILNNCKHSDYMFA